MILEIIKLLWKDTTLKRIHVHSIGRRGQQLSLTLRGIGETSASGGQTPSEGRQATQGECVLSIGSTATVSVKPGFELQMLRAAGHSPHTENPFFT